MTIRTKSKAVKELEKLRKAPFTFKDLLYSVRTTEEITQVELAKKLKVSKAKICDYEKGRRVPSMELASKMAKVLGHSEALFVAKLLEDQIKESNLKLKITVEAA